MFYLLLAFLLFIGAIYYAYKGKPLSRGVKLTLFLCFWLIAGLAWQTGVDWKVYEAVFDQAHTIGQVFKTGAFASDDISTEPGYKLLSSIVKSFSDEYQMLQLSALFIGSVFFFKALSKYTQNYFAALLIYLGYVYLTLNMSGIRQAVSLSIVFYGLQFVKNKQFWRYFIVILFAAMFHYSSLIMIPCYWLLNKKIPAKLLFTILGCGLLVYIGRIAIISGTIERVSEAIGNPIFYRLYLYVTATEDALPSISPKMFLNLIFIVMFLLRRDAMIEKNKYANIFINLFTIYIILGQYMWDTGDIVTRLQHYFVIGLVILFPIYLETLRYTGNRIILTCFIFVLSIWSSNPIFFESPSRIIYNPYQNYLWHQITGQPSTGEDRLKQWANDE